MSRDRHRGQQTGKSSPTERSDMGRRLKSKNKEERCSSTVMRSSGDQKQTAAMFSDVAEDLFPFLGSPLSPCPPHPLPATPPTQAELGMKT